MKLLILSLLLVFPSQALAYLDPGSASLLIQGLIAGIASAAAVIALYWQKFKSLFKHKVDDNNATDNTPDEPID